MGAACAKAAGKYFTGMEYSAISRNVKWNIETDNCLGVKCGLKFPKPSGAFGN